MGVARSDLTLKPLGAGQYRQVGEWRLGSQAQDFAALDWDSYAAEMNGSQWLHFGLYAGAAFVGCLSLEKTGPASAEYHVVAARHALDPRRMAGVLLDTASYFFNQGFTALTARIPADNRAAVRLAIRCGMRELGRIEPFRYFILTARRYRNYAQSKT